MATHPLSPIAFSTPRPLRGRRWCAFATLAWLIVAGAAGDGAVARAAGADLPAAREMPIPRRILLLDVERTQVQISPDGTRVGYLQDGDLRVAGLAHPDRPRRITVRGEAGAIVRWTWAYDGLHALIERRTPAGTRVLLLEPATGRARDLLPGRTGRSSLAAISPWHPDEAVLVHERGEGGVVYRVPFEGGDPVALAEAFDFDAIWVDRDLQVRAGMRAAATWKALYRHRPGEGWTHLVSYDAEAARLAGVLGVTADGRALHVVDNRGRDKAALKRLDLETGAETVLAEDPVADLSGNGAIVDPWTGSVQGAVSYLVRQRRHLIDRRLAEDFESLDRAAAGDVEFIGRSVDDAVWLVRRLAGGPAIYESWDRARRQRRPLFSELPAMDGRRLATRHAALIPARDGLLLPADLYLPRGADPDGDGRPVAPLPALVFVHGGPWIGFEWNSWSTNRHLQLLADRGYAVLRPDFRGSAGYGRAFMDRGDREWGGRILDDLVDVAAWAADNRVADPGRIGLWGWSFGGYATLAGLATFPDRFACGLSLYGLSDLETFMDRVVPAGHAETWKRRLGDPRTAAGRARLRAHSPIHAVARIRGPILLSHGGRDGVAPIAQSDRMVDALRSAGTPVTYLVFPEEGHDYRQVGTWVSFWSEAERFLADHLGGRFEGPAAGGVLAGSP